MAIYGGLIIIWSKGSCALSLVPLDFVCYGFNYLMPIQCFNFIHDEQSTPTSVLPYAHAPINRLGVGTDALESNSRTLFLFSWAAMCGGPIGISNQNLQEVPRMHG